MHGIYLGEETHQVITSEKKKSRLKPCFFFRLSTMLYSFKLKKKKKGCLAIFSIRKRRIHITVIINIMKVKKRGTITVMVSLLCCIYIYIIKRIACVDSDKALFSLHRFHMHSLHLDSNEQKL